MKNTAAVCGYIFLLICPLISAGGNGEAPTSSGSSSSENWLIETGGFPEVNALGVSGNIIIAGSSTVFPAAEYLAVQFEDEGYQGRITIDSIGSGAGFERFSNGETDISNASRAVNPSEVEDAAAVGITPIEFRIGTDALSIVVNPLNTWVNNAGIEELAHIFTAELWSDVNPAWPNTSIQKFVPGTDSGTFDYFVEEVFDKDPRPLLEASNIQFSEDDNILVQGIEGSPNGIAFFGYAYYVEQAEKLKIISIEGVEANSEAIDAGTYPLARPLFMYSDAGIMKNKPHVAAFLAFVLGNADRAMNAVGYFPAPDTDIEMSKRSWEKAVDRK